MRRLTRQIRTPEGVIFHQTLAGPVIRFVAWLIDFLITIAAVYLLNTAVVLLQWIDPNIAQAVAILLMFALNVGYGMAFEWFWRGQTFGKRIMRLRVMDAEGLRLQPSQVVLRNLLRVVDLLPLAYAVGGTCALFSPLGQRLGDLAAGTVVVRIPHTTQPNIDPLVVGRYNSLRAFPHIAARLRHQTSPAEASLALQALMRRNDIDDDSRVRVFAEIADHFRALAPFPPESAEGLTDEHYLRNVVDILFRVKPGSETSSAPPTPQIATS